jgi:hypothetical protein
MISFVGHLQMAVAVHWQEPIRWSPDITTSMNQDE